MVEKIDKNEVIKTLEKVEMEVAPVFNETEKQILYYRFGINDGVHHSLADTGRKFDYTRERIRQIEAKLLEKMNIVK